jgi:enamine deaminase RidA (YjgF/YER057c/UK114 family)
MEFNMSDKIDLKLNELGIVLPMTPIPLATYVPAKQVGNLIFTSGQLPIIDGEVQCKGLVGGNIQVSTAYDASQICLLNALSAIKSVIGDLDSIVQIVKLTGYVASTSSFTQQPEVINGASDLLIKIFEEKGKHTRTAIGVSALPRDATVEIELIVEIK